MTASNNLMASTVTHCKEAHELRQVFSEYTEAWCWLLSINKIKGYLKGQHLTKMKSHYKEGLLARQICFLYAKLLIANTEFFNMERIGNYGC